MIKISIYQNNKKILGGITNIEEDKVKEIIDSERPITTTIDSTSTDTEIPSAKSVYDKYNIHDKSEAYSNIITNPLYVDVLNADSRYNKDGIVSRDTAEDLTTFTFPIDCSWGIREIFWKSEYNLVNKITGMDLNNKPGTWINVLRGDASTHTWSGWQRLCTTTVADVPSTVVTTTNTNVNTNAGYIRYRVKNGICLVSLYNVVIIATGQQIISDSLPTPEGVVLYGGSLTSTSTGDVAGYMFVNNGESKLLINVKNTGVSLYGSFSYPVAES